VVIIGVVVELTDLHIVDTFPIKERTVTDPEELWKKRPLTATPDEK
jgi:hypothetical protein